MGLATLNPTYLAYASIFMFLIFTLAWQQDSKIHQRILSVEEHKREVLTHKLILIPSVLMEISLLAMFWFPWEALPFFLATYLTRTIHEAIDESMWHTKRCESFESFLHLVMWISVHTKTILLFVWAFFKHFEGWDQLPTWFYALLALLLLVNSFVASKEIKLQA